MALSEAEDWNQTLNDWNRLAEGPLNHCLVAESDNRIIGTATAMNYLNAIAWIGMVLVDKDYRGRGIGKAMVSSLLDLLGLCKSIKLDATTAGQPLYEKLGFRNDYLINRMINVAEINTRQEESKVNCESVQLSDISEISQLDQATFGADRKYLIASLLNENSVNAWCIRHNGRVTAFSLGRKGRKYLHIGPVVATGLKQAKSLISAFCADYKNLPVVLDVLADKMELVNWLKSIGFTQQRQFFRMYLHQNPFPASTMNNYLICGPEFG
jgi:GNAT superfamily N-acetyltransferase